MTGSRAGRFGGRAFAVALALATFYAGVHWGSTTAGGADSYGYVSQAGLWLDGRLTVAQDLARQSPWPNAIDTWAPLGYRASPHQPGAIVPLYSPGLPLMMALAQAVGGFCAAFLVVPFCGALTVWLTWVVGRRLFGREAVGAAAAILVATSPIFLYQLMNPMTDVPAAAAWTLALAAAVSGWPLAAGLASGAAVLVRPNLAPVAVVLCGWLLLTGGRAPRFLLGLAPGVAAVGWINARLYESALVSGYGTLAELYSTGHLAANARQFGVWIVETQTPVVLLGLAGFGMPRLFADTGVRHPRVLVGGVAAAILASYLFYLPFDAWWYLRFLLPLWPILMVLTAAGIDAVVLRPAGRFRDALLMACAVVLGANGVRIAAERFAFDVGRAERRYIDVARFVSSRTEPGAVMIALQHSGALRMYAGRTTLRYDQLDPAWLDRAVAFLASTGRHPYIVLEGGERRAFEHRFGGANQAGRLSWPAFGRLDGADVTIYDAIARGSAGEPLAIAAAASRRAGWRCDPPQTWPASRSTLGAP